METAVVHTVGDRAWETGEDRLDVGVREIADRSGRARYERLKHQPAIELRRRLRVDAALSTTPIGHRRRDPPARVAVDARVVDDRSPGTLSGARRRDRPTAGRSRVVEGRGAAGSAAR